MKEELDALLCSRYPLIFAGRNLPMEESAMYWGFACGDGWFDLVDTLCERLQFWTDHNKAPQVVAVQVKEKWGELCFYADGQPNEAQKGMIWMAEAMSARICELCGKPGQTLINGHFHLTRCAEHAPEGAITKAQYLDQWPLTDC